MGESPSLRRHKGFTYVTTVFTETPCEEVRKTTVFMGKRSQCLKQKGEKELDDRRGGGIHVLKIKPVRSSDEGISLGGLPKEEAP